MNFIFKLLIISKDDLRYRNYKLYALETGFADFQLNYPFLILSRTDIDYAIKGYF